MSKLQSEEKHDLRYKANRELIWGIGLLLMSSQVGIADEGTWLTVLLGLFGMISLGQSLYYNWKLGRDE